MSSRRSGRLAWIVLPLTVIAGVLWLRHDAHGLRNGFSPTYWVERLTGRLLYDPSKVYLKHGDPSEPVVALTFDDGPHPTSASQILDVLNRRHVKATFFLVGKRIKEHPEIVRRIIAEGHEVGNHTQDHLRLDTLRPDQIAHELDNCAVNVERAVPGQRLELFRPPGMRFNADVIEAAKQRGYTMVGWNDAAKDFISLSHRHADPSFVERRVVDQVENGSIILLHDIPATAEVLDQILDAIEKKGFRIEPVSKMLAKVRE